MAVPGHWLSRMLGRAEPFPLIPLHTLLASPFLFCFLHPPCAASLLPPGLASHTHGVYFKHQDPNPCTDRMGWGYSLPSGTGTSSVKQYLMLGCAWAPSQSRRPAERDWVCSLCSTPYAQPSPQSWWCQDAGLWCLSLQFLGAELIGKGQFSPFASFLRPCRGKSID